eukprot:1394466-Amorphochlora_amoeboformis.AAC.3
MSFQRTYRKGGKTLIGNWYEERWDQPKLDETAEMVALGPVIAFGATGLRRKPLEETGERVVQKPVGDRIHQQHPVFVTENKLSFGRPIKPAPEPNIKMVQYSNFEQMNCKRYSESFG